MSGSKSIIHCGDALTVLPTLPDGSVDLIFTDPPYGVPISLPIKNGAKARNRRLEAPTPNGLSAARHWVPGDDRADDLFLAFLTEAARLLKPRGNVLCCCCGGGGPLPLFARWALWLDQTPGFRFNQIVVWDKGMGMGWRYRRSYEVVLVASRAKAPMRWFDASNRVENVIRHIRRATRSENTHPAEKPVALAAHFIRLHSQKGDTVLDPFCGCGSTGVAAARMGRNFIGIELHPPYAEEAKRRVRLEGLE